MALEAPPVVKNNQPLDRWLYALYYEFKIQEGQLISIADTGVVANTTFSVAHGLGRIPLNVILVVDQNVSTTTYPLIRPSGTAWTTTTISLQCNTANADIKIKVW